MSDLAASVPDIQATVVGSYPVPPWLTVAPSGEALLDATRSVFQIQELAVIDVKTHRVETPEDVARQIASAVGILGPGRVRWVCPDCGFWMNKRSIADRKIAALVQGRDLFPGRK